MKSLIIALTALVLFGCTPGKSKLVWDKNFPVIGSQSSPRAADLNGDGVLDIVMGGGKNEFQDSEQGILAFDGKTGNILWQQSATDQVYGSATFFDISGDGTVDVFIGGRSPQFKALDGTTGVIIWEYQYDSVKADPILTYARFNFNNSVLIPDQDGNGFPELLTVNGGNAVAAPDSEVDRFPGVLMLFDAKSGNVIAADTMPDGRESYMSPVCIPPAEGKSDVSIVFGTGGETISGNLYMAAIADLMEKKLHRAKIIASETGHGFIAPPSLADITGDGHVDIVSISHAGRLYAINGLSQAHIWKQEIKNTECSNSLAVGYFTPDEVPDFFTFTSKGEWPNSAGSRQVLIDGADGRIVQVDSLGCTGFSSPVVYDLNNDGIDEAIISINEYDCSLGFASKSPDAMENKLLIIDFANKSVSGIDQTKGFKNIFTTPWIGDLDQNGKLDLVYCQYYHYSDLLAFLGMRMKRVDLPIEIERPVAWGAYMGSAGDGVFSISK